MNRRLKIGIVLESLEAPAWIRSVLEAIARSSFAALELVRVAPASGSALAAVYRLDRRLHRVKPDAFATSSVLDLLAGATVVDRDRDPPDVDLDVLLRLGGARADERLAGRARHGVWSCDADDTSLAGGAPGFWEVYAGEPVTRTGIRIAGPTEVRCHSWIATDGSSIERNRSRMYWRAAALLVRKLEELAALGFEELVRRATRDHALGDSQDRRRRALPSAADAARLAARIVVRQAGIQARYRVQFEQWVLLHSLDSPGAPSLAHFEELAPPKDRAWADPHLLVRDGKHYLFIEEQPLDTRKGHISVLALEGGRWSPPVKVLETGYHLSNPFVFEHDGSLYMVPESAANRTVDLYRCDRFPDRWTHVRTVFSGVRANDATLLAHGDRWWMFVSMNAHPGSSSHEELFLFHAADPVSGDWTPHPRNPVVSDVRRARPAGPVLVRNGVLIRPAQDCSVRYGYGIRFMRIARLDEADYEESEVARLEPRWDPRYVGTHTFDQAGPVTVVDALRLRSRR